MNVERSISAAASSADDDDPDSPRRAPDAAEPPLNVVHVTVDALGDLAGRCDCGWIGERLAEAVGRLSCPVAAVEVSVIEDAAMAALHREHLGESRSTDVLSFDLSEAGEPVHAAIAVCIDEAARCADAEGHAIERELLLYALHGLLHCCGHDDHDKAGYERMHAEEDRILEAIGVGATFARSTTGASRGGAES